MRSSRAATEGLSAGLRHNRGALGLLHPIRDHARQGPPAIAKKRAFSSAIASTTRSDNSLAAEGLLGS